MSEFHWTTYLAEQETPHMHRSVKIVSDILTDLESRSGLLYLDSCDEETQKEIIRSLISKVWNNL